ncbi:translocation/assembly module TamB domain-containing protein [Roseovarius salis]|uniref:translocation/assembly module TamB domain-containing protein n=1 Tax=Roseovarius salis TaxID=3376063 RepID=UPI0037C88049
MRCLHLIILCAVIALPAAAQDQPGNGKTFLEGLIEDALSADARTVTVTGFEGALSSNATLERMTIADARGVWLTLEDASLVWSRTALLQGRLDVEELTAASIDLARLPEGEERLTPERAEAKPFALPDLPVAVSIGTLRAERVRLGPQVLGEEAVLRVESSLELSGGTADAALDIRRVGRADRITLDAAFSNESRRLGIDLDFDEAEGGLVSHLLRVPGRPALRLQVTGDAPLSEFEARVALSSDGERRLAGPVRIEAAEAPGGTRFSADLAGDLSPLFGPDLHPFFGRTSRLRLAGLRAGDGRLTVEEMLLRTGAMEIAGSFAIAPDGLPERIDVDGRIGNNGRLRLPVAAPVTHVRRATVSVDYDAARGDTWQAAANVAGLESGALTVREAEIDGTGKITRGDGATVSGEISFGAEGVGHGDPALDRAIGDAQRGRAAVSWGRGGALRVERLDITGGDVSLSARGIIEGVADGFPVEGRAVLRSADLGRFAPLARRDLGGTANAAIEGRGTLLGGAFDVVVAASTTDLRTGVSRLDPLLTGRSTLDIAAARDQAGTRLDRFSIRNGSVSADAAGRLDAQAGMLALTAEVSDLSLAEPRLQGPGKIDTRLGWEAGGPLVVSRLHAEAVGASLDASGTVLVSDADLPAQGKLTLKAGDLSRLSALTGQQLAGQIDLEAEGAGALRGRRLDARLSLEGAGVRTGMAQLDKVIAGDITFDADLAYGDGLPSVNKLALVTPRLSAKASNDSPGAPVELSARLSDLAVVAPGFDGPAQVNGTVRFAKDARQAADVDLGFAGPGETSARITGEIRDAGRTLDLGITGQAQLALANGFIAPRSVSGPVRFDLRVQGAPRLSSLSGTIGTNGARAALPALKTALTDLGGELRLDAGEARLNITGNAGKGGGFRLQGPISLSAPYTAALALDLSELGIHDPSLYETEASGRVTVDGPLTGGARIAGAVTLGRTELRVPSAAPGGPGMLGGIRHVAEPAAVRRTRERAGLIQTAKRGATVSFPLDLRINAPNRIFVRGRGLDAELGGQLRLGGTTADVNASGVFNLIRGRIDVLTKRLDLTEGIVDLRGALDPYLRFVARTETDELSVNVVLEGPASAPEVRFTSSPDLPQEEILAQLLFGRSFDRMSAFQAAQLVSAAATLSGSGGVGFTGRLRDTFGLSDFDVTSTDGGATRFTAGAYISENIYSEVSADSEGNNQINLNLDLSRSLTVKGKASNDGDTGIGIFFEKDY